MHKTIVFLETSLTHDSALQLLQDATYVRSIKMGDVLKAIQEGYRRVVIIDGNFSWVPSVWHKEILIALDYGLEVWGAASMGALRAAELDAFGMKGYGRIYERYKNEEIDGDDEVALVYSKYNQEQTIPLVNIRFTLEQIDIPNKGLVLEAIRAIYFAERTWGKIAQTVSYEICDQIKTHYIDAKKEDAASLLLYLNQQHLSNEIFDLAKKSRKFTFFEKKLIESTLTPIESIFTERDSGEGIVHQVRAMNIIKLLTISETKKNKQHYQSILMELDQEAYDITEYELMYQVEQFREERHLLKGDDFFHWLQRRDLHESNLEQLFTDYVKLAKYKLLTYDYNQYFS
ncbi:TfuA-like protein [Legionella sp. km772]|uniref:TfuA-like protein n=1 Tax=Legionella sp. km772 TaxID=2498111 RepID=UPI000F8E8914|nr:TfuA-like protein [Legionella sp. km772]RUR14104.1 TfuA-like protein [Legionella sp. km772]